MGLGPNIKSEILSLLADTEVSTPVIARWNETTGATVDGITGASIGGTTAQKVQSFRGFAYEVNGTFVTRTNADIQMGDLILDIDPDVYAVFSSKKGVVFTCQDKQWVQKIVGDTLNGIWDASINGAAVLTTILLTRRK